MNTPTPLTDAEQDYVGHVKHPAGWMLVRSAFARQLEQDLNEVRAERDKLRSVVDELFWLARMADYDSQRSDEAINSYNKLPHVIERKTK